jgi:hypothetical protein
MDKKCFIIMPFKEELLSLFEKVKLICQDLNVECRRSDEIAIGSITKGIFEEIYFADFVIADLTYANPNVYYELAISHCIGRKTILITQDEKIPFDIGQEYIIRYTNTIGGSIILEKQLRRLFTHLLDGGTIDNPAQMFLPKSQEEEKFEKLSDMSKEILIALAESRKVEMEIVASLALLTGPASAKNVKDDLEKLNALIDKIKNHS